VGDRIGVERFGVLKNRSSSIIGYQFSIIICHCDGHIMTPDGHFRTGTRMISGKLNNLANIP
jgi:hypothetical protein